MELNILVVVKEFRIYFLLIMILTNGMSGYTQEKHDYVWVLGGSSGGAGTILDFNHTPALVLDQDIELRMSVANTGICNNVGRLLFYSNSCFIANREHRIMVNGAQINPGIINELFCIDGRGSPAPQGAIALPWPGQPDKFYIINLDMEELFVEETSTITLTPFRLHYHIVDLKGDEGLGVVIVKNEVAMQDTFAKGNVHAVRHANGYDWWVIVPKRHSNCYFLLPVTSAGIGEPILKCAGTTWTTQDSGQMVFSPDGTRFLRFNYFNGLHVYDFDSETGNLSNARTLDFPDDTFPSHTGVSVSPSSQYAYVSARRRLYQVDLHMTELSALLVAELDQTNIPNSPDFCLSKLAPDGKIYISGFNSSPYLHIVHRPDCPGELCHVELRGLQLTSFNLGSMPNMPHYRNEPPDIDCDSIVSSTSVHQLSDIAEVYPVPARDHINITVPEEAGEVILELYDMNGRVILHSVKFTGQSRVDLPVVPVGMYFYRIHSLHRKDIFTGKLVIGIH